VLEFGYSVDKKTAPKCRFQLQNLLLLSAFKGADDFSFGFSFVAPANHFDPFAWF